MVATTPLADSPWAEARWMVIVPHADDETLGAGSLIATAAAKGCLACVVYLTDGGGSHSHKDAASRERLVQVRRREAEQALATLCEGQSPPTVFLDWPDAHPHEPDSEPARSAVTRLSELCRTHSATAIAVTALHEPHCDHAAAARLARSVSQAATPAVPVFEYLVWAESPPPGSSEAVVTSPMSQTVRRQALDAHVSQLTDAMGPGFRLDPARRQMPESDVLYLLGQPDAT